MASFRILVSAELESYIEETAEEFLNKAKYLREAGKFTKTSATLLATQKDTSCPSATSEIKDRCFYLRACMSSEAQHARVIEANKGASSHNFLRLFVPLGLDETKLDEQFLHNLGLLAVRRGDFAHKRVGAVQNIPNVVEDQALILSIARNLQSIEAQLDAALGTE